MNNGHRTLKFMDELTDIGFKISDRYTLIGDGILSKISSAFLIWFFGSNKLKKINSRNLFFNGGIVRYEMGIGKGKLKVNLFIGYRDDQTDIKIQPGNKYQNGDFIIFYENGNKLELVLTGNNKTTKQSEVLSSIREYRFKKLLDK